MMSATLSPAAQTTVLIYPTNKERGLRQDPSTRNCMPLQKAHQDLRKSRAGEPHRPQNKGRL